MKIVNAMFCTKSRPFLLLPKFFFILSIFFLFSHGASSYYHTPTKSFAGSRYGVVGRFGLKGIHVKIEEENSTLVLAADRTHRKDPLDNFNYYKGGWNITEKHYFSSVGFTAAPLFLIAGFWFLGFGISLLLISPCHNCCQHDQHYDYSKIIYLISLIFLTFFTIAAITGCIVLYFAQGSFHSSTTNTVEYVVEQADITVDKLRNVSESLQVAKLIGVNQISLPPNIQADIESVDKKINDYAKTLESETKGNSGKTRHVLDSIKLALIIIASVMLLLAFLGFAFSVSGMPISVYISVIIGWILVTVIFVLCGMFIIVQNTMTDTCVAMDQWVQYPRAQTSLDDILPCMDHTTAQQALDESNDVTNSLIGIVNDFISNVANSNIPRDGSPIFYNQSGPVVPLLCSSPYNSDKSCNDDQVNFSNAAEEWKKYLCKVSTKGICITKGRLTPMLYDQMTDAVNVCYTLHQCVPFLVDVGDCTFFRQIISTISKDHCPELKQSTEMISLGLVIVSISLMLSVTLWLFYARNYMLLQKQQKQQQEQEQEQQEYNKYQIASSAQPSGSSKKRSEKH